MAGSRHQRSSQQLLREHEYYDVESKQSGTTHRIRVPQCDIDASIKFSWIRCLFSISGILLVLSDIPRSGFGVFDLAADFEQVAPNTVLYFGPYAYCGAQLHREGNNRTSFAGTCDASTLTATQVWSYKYDSLSIALRGIVQALDVREYPRCLLYITECASEYLSLGATFTMLDALVSALYEHHFQHSRMQRGDTFIPYVLQTTSYWIDRIHHTVLDKVNYHRIDTRLHVAHYYQRQRNNSSSSNLRLCHPELSGIARPTFCTEIIGWNIDVTQLADAASIKMNADEHIEWRLSALEMQHPNLEFDLTVLTTLQATSNRGRVRFGAETHYKSESNEIVTIIRGRVCERAASASSSAMNDHRCTTHLIDDYRYERALLHTNVEDWYSIVRLLRATAQVYMWVRIACLWGGCYLARRGEPKFIAAALPQRLYWTTVTVFKIPSHVIVYGSWIPIVLYVLAYGIDCGVVHLLCERVWTSLNGAVRFDFLAYVKAASVQMRNAWLVALAVNAFALLQVRCLSPRHAPWLLRHGLVGVRGGLIGLLSSITIFSYLRFPAFRNTSIVTVRELSVEALRKDQHSMQQFETASEFGFFFDLRAVLVGVTGVLSATLVLKLYLWWPRWWGHRRGDARESGFTTKVIFSRLHCLPYSVGTLVSLTALSVFWHITVLSDAPERTHARPRKPLPGVSSNKVAALETALSIAPSATNKSFRRLPSLHEPSLCSKPHCRMCARRRSSLLVMHDAVDRNVFFDVEKRSSESWATVQLINIALLTEPLVLWNLIVTGQELYIYRTARLPSSLARDSSTPASELSHRQHHPPLFLLPCDLQTLVRNADDEDAGSDPQHHYELVDTVWSTSIVWRLLAFCG